jgi:putative nucleotidyltransferase with HDIG domain
MPPPNWVAAFFMLQLPLRARVLWLIVTMAGSIALALSGVLASWDLKYAAPALLFAIAGAIAERFHVNLPTSTPGNRAFMSLGASVATTAALVFPLPWALVIVGLARFCGPRTSWIKHSYNICQIVLGSAVAGLIWMTRPSSSTLVDLTSVPWILATLASYFATTQLLTLGIVTAASGLPLRPTLVRTNRHTWPASTALLFIGVLVAILWTTSPWAIALAAIPLTAVYYSLRNTVSLETNTIEALFQLADILDARDTYTHGHSLRVGQYAEKLALKLGLSGDDAHMVFLAGRLHDIGKCAIRNEVLLKPGALDEDERAHMCIHPEVGGSMLASFSLFRECARYVRGHHERWDGKGYPDGLIGEAIPLGARIIAVADSFDAMTTTRPYRKALPVSEAHRRLGEGSGTQWDPRVVAAFLELLDTTPLGQPEPLTLPTSQPKLPAANAA